MRRRAAGLCLRVLRWLLHQEVQSRAAGEALDPLPQQAGGEWPWVPSRGAWAPSLHACWHQGAPAPLWPGGQRSHPGRCPSPSPQGWIPSASSPTPLMWLPGATRGCPATAHPPRMPPSSATPSGGPWSWTPSSRASSGSRTNTGRSCGPSAWARGGGSGAEGLPQAQAGTAPPSPATRGAWGSGNQATRIPHQSRDTRGQQC